MIAIRKLGNSRGVILPKPLLKQAGLKGEAEVRVERGEVWLTALDPTVGSEIRKARPCVVISPPEMHDHLRTAIAAPMTTGSRPAPFRIPVSFGGKRGLILLDQLRTLDQVRLVKRLGAIAPAALATALKTLQEIFAD